MKNSQEYDVIVIGGGFYGCMLALFLRNYFERVVVIEKEKNLLTRASYNNQARVHNGYHYPRSFITALRSHLNFSKFVSEFKDAIDDEFTMIYAIATNSKISSSQFVKFCRAVGSKVNQAPDNIKKLFNKSLIEDVFLVEEVAFNAVKLRKIMKNKLQKANVKIITNCEVKKVISSKDRILVSASKRKSFLGKYVFNCTYSQINNILKNSNLQELPFKYELTEMPLVEMPKELRNYAFTIIDGPFFSFVPFPSRKLHSLHHVRYTPYESLFVSPKDIKKSKSRFLYMIKDAQRYIPSLKNVKYKDSLFEIKTILMENELNDGRPILYRQNHGINNFHIVMGGKIDNIYDILSKVKKSFD